MKKKKLRWIATILGLIVIIFHVCWFYNYSLFTKFTDGLDEFEKFIAYSILEDDYIYHVKIPSYPYFVGNLAVATGDSEYTLIIWPSRFENTEYGVRIPNSDDSVIGIMINRDLVAEDEYNQPFVNENREYIEELFQKANGRWGTKFE